MQESLVELTRHPGIAGLMVVLLVAAIFFLFRRLLSLAGLFLLGFLGVLGYYSLTEKEPPPALKTITEKAKEGAQLAREKAEEATEKVREASEKVDEDLKEAAKSGLGEALED